MCQHSLRKVSTDKRIVLLIHIYISNKHVNKDKVTKRIVIPEKSCVEKQSRVEKSYILKGELAKDRDALVLLE